MFVFKNQYTTYSKRKMVIKKFICDDVSKISGSFFGYNELVNIIFVQLLIAYKGKIKTRKTWFMNIFKCVVICISDNFRGK